MTWKPQRRQRYEGLNPTQWGNALADDLDLLEGTLDEHIEDDMAAHATTAEAFQEWKLALLRSQNRMLFAVVLALIAALVSILVPLVTR